MTDLTIKQYEDAIKNALSARQIELLQILYSFPNSTATTKELATFLNPEKPVSITAAGQIGKIGKAIAIYLQIKTDQFYNRGRNPAYFLLVGPYYPNEGKIRGEEIGYEMKENLRIALENLKLVSSIPNEKLAIEILPTELIKDGTNDLYTEGKVVQVFVNRYERNQKARLECIKYFGTNCSVCGFDFGRVYGDIAQNFIHVHHKIQLADISNEYQVDPINDLIPLCANCHSVIHLTKPVMTIDELKRRMEKSSR